MGDGTVGAYVISWSQTAIDDVAAAAPGELCAGVSWRWVGQALRVDGPSGAAMLGQAMGVAELHERAARSARRLCAPVVPLAVRAPAPLMSERGDDPLLDRGFLLTDGRGTFNASLIDPGQGRAPLVLFHGAPPPREHELWVVRVFNNRRTEARLGRRPEMPVTGLAAGTRLITSQGARPVETLRPGDRVRAGDGGFRELRWRGLRRYTAADFGLAPRDRPLRVTPAAFGARWTGPDLVIGSDQHLSLGGPAVRTLFDLDVVLVRAGDLCGHPGVRTDFDVSEVIYVQLLFDRHQTLPVHGMGCESFHPDMAAPPGEAFLEPGLLRQLGAEILRDPSRYGPPVQRRLGRAEAALLCAGGDLRAAS